MGNYIKTVGIWLIGVFMIGMILNVNKANFKVDNRNSHIERALEITLIKEQDKSNRNTDGFTLDRANFETKFLERLETYEKGDFKSAEFSYLPSKKYPTNADMISGVKVKLITTDGKSYQGTYLIDTKSEPELP